MTKKVNTKADNNKTTMMLDRIDRGVNDMNRKMRTDYVTLEQMDTKLYRLNEE